MIPKNVNEVFEFWSLIEYLQPQEVPKISASDLVWRVDKEAEFPWRDQRKSSLVESRLRLQRGGDQKRTVFLAYCGIFESEDVSADLEQWHGGNEHDENRKSERKKRSAAVLVKLDAQGVVFDVGLASLPWAMGRLKPGAQPKYDSFHGDNGFETAVREKLLDSVSEIEVDLTTGQSRRRFHEFSFTHFMELTQVIWKESGWSPRNPSPDTFIATKFVADDAESMDDDLLNSFIVEDLAHVAGRVAKGDIGRGLSTYLSDPGAGISQRTDILRGDAEMISGLSVEKLPMGRWPSRHGLAAAQQYAVNQATSMMRQQDGGIFSVNGPPGTGKTTLLKDIVADVITARAEILASFASPKGAFGARFKLGRDYEGYVLDGRLLDSLIVVASSNNAAIENVTKELPAEKSVDVPDLKIDFFKSISDHLMSGDRSPNTKTPQEISDSDNELSEHYKVATWGLISAALGNGGNRKSFVKKFWFGDTQYDGTREPRSMQAFLRGMPVGEDWGAARNRFIAERMRVEGHIAEASEIEAGLVALSSAQTKRNRLQRSMREMSGVLDQHKGELVRQRALASGLERNRAETASAVENWKRYRYFVQAVAAAEAELSDSLAGLKADGHPVQYGDLEILLRQLHREYDLEQKSKPGFLTGLLRPSLLKAWAGRCQTINGKIGKIEIALERNRRYLRAVADEVAKPDFDEGNAISSLKRLSSQLDEVRLQIKTTEDLVNSLTRRSAEISEQFHKEDNSIRVTKRKLQAAGISERELEAVVDIQSPEFHLAVPMLAKRLMEARHSLFVAALELHKSFIDHARKEIRANLSLLCDYLNGAEAPNSDAMPHLWNTLALVVPVVSTTFASFPRLFKCMNRESIGWLLLDEAGQATPQAAVGAIWRSKRTIVVGDPLQLEPVVTLPEGSIETLRKRFGLDDEWHPIRRSCQVLADRSNKYGTYIGQGEERRWVGSPLVVHRRCLDPMFKVANKIAYGDLMVYGTAPEKETPSFDAGGSRWIDAKATGGNLGHWVPSQGDIALKMVRQVVDTASLRNEDGSYNIFIITPYRDVARGMVDLLNRNGIEKADKMCGTIHTFQGREADTVILLLGGDPQKRSAVGAFAAKTPNLLNVAITRAKRRVYVIGDANMWAGARYFSDLYAALQEPTVRANQ